jgi:aminoglycoside phosphotransferase
MVPPELGEIIKNYSIQEYPYIESGARIYLLTSTQSKLYLKIRINDPEQRLLREYTTLTWIKGRILSPEVIYNHNSSEISFLLTTAVAGTPINQAPKLDRPDAMIAAAQTLRFIHSIPISGCPYINTLKTRLEKTRTLNLNDDQKTVLNRLESSPPSETLSFTHGDYCLPNILVTGAYLNGVIDWDSSGIADPYIDLASAAWSIEYNFPDEAEELLNVFLNAYGVEIDERKFDYYLDLIQLHE